MTDMEELQRKTAQLVRKWSSKGNPDGFIDELLDVLEDAGVLQDAYLVYEEKNSS